MIEDNNYAIKTLPLFKRMVQPFNVSEVEKTKEDLMNNPDLRVIQTWRGNHLKDEQKYELCKSLSLPVTISELYFESWEEAALFVCENQLERKDLTDEYRKYLVGGLFHYKLLQAGDLSKAESKTNLANDIGKHQYVSGGAVQKYKLYFDALNFIFDCSESLAKRILLGQTRVSHENTIELSRLNKDELCSLSKIIEGDNVSYITLSYIRNEVKWSHIQEAKPKQRAETEHKSKRNVGKVAGIRKMPEYNPDAEVNSLCMTMDSWVSSIERVKKSENFGKISGKASLQLMNKLTFLQHTISGIQESLLERTEL